MDRGAWWATVHGVAKLKYDLATKPPPPVFWGSLLPFLKKKKKKSPYYKTAINSSSLLTTLEQFLRVFWNAVSQAAVLIWPQIKLNSRFSCCAFFFFFWFSFLSQQCEYTTICLSILVLIVFWIFLVWSLLVFSWQTGDPVEQWYSSIAESELGGLMW